MNIREIAFDSALHADIPVEVVGYRDLVRRMGRDHFAAAQRPDLGLMFVVFDGRGSHQVDFETLELRPARAVLVRPGQVQQWDVSSEVEAAVILVRPELCSIGRWFPGHAAYRDFDATSMTTASDLVAAVRREQARFLPDEAIVRLMQSLFTALLALYERAQSAPPATVLPDAYLAFCRAIEGDLVASRDARTYISALGYSERTVNRACKKVTGLSAKAVLDRRIVLEAKRILAHTDLAVANVSAGLGFSEPSNFNRFFRRIEGRLPTEFRGQLRAAGYGVGTV